MPIPDTCKICGEPIDPDERIISLLANISLSSFPCQYSTLLAILFLTLPLIAQNQERLSVHYMDIQSNQYEEFLKYHNKKNEILEKAGFGKNFYKLYKVKEYKNKILFDETKLFCDWYAPKILSKSKSIQFKKKFRLEIKKLLSKLNYKNVTFVHRDFHVSNLMYYNKKIAVIDSQDALIGNRAYDLASLIDDVRLKTSNELKDKVFKFYIKTNKRIDLKKFKKDFEILSVLRNLKIIGIFMRLAERDNKKKYLKLIPYAWELINHRIKEQNQFNNLMLLLKNNFPKFIR